MSLTDRAKLFELTRADIPELGERSQAQVAPLDPRHKVFTNRNLRLDKVEVIGFDMDYTLAIYKKLKIEELAFHCTVEKLVKKKGYPAEIREIRYEPDRVIRGLLIDKKRGNLLKMDRYGHAGRAFHGSQPIPKDERIALYRSRKFEPDSFNYAWVDTLFSLPEACLYSQLVDFFEKRVLGDGEKKPSFRTLYEDTRECIDEAHADDSLKNVIKANPDEYIVKEAELAHVLHRFRSSGKRLFLLTNSAWDYTKAVMSFLLDGVLPGYPNWRSYFDVTIVSAMKPLFFVKRTPFARVDEATGQTAPAETVNALERSKIYAGGNLRDFERLAHIGGERILYVGDHIYGDILRSKKSSLWRTAMVLPELSDVVWHHELYAADAGRYSALEDEMRRIDSEVNYYKMFLNSLVKLKEDNKDLSEPELRAIDDAGRQARKNLEVLKGQLRAMSAEHDDIERRFNETSNRYWGLLFDEGNETSLFGKQVEDYACLYTGRVANFLYYSPLQYFRSPPHLMPHERVR